MMAAVIFIGAKSVCDDTMLDTRQFRNGNGRGETVADRWKAATLQPGRLLHGRSMQRRSTRHGRGRKRTAPTGVAENVRSPAANPASTDESPAIPTRYRGRGREACGARDPPSDE